MARTDWHRPEKFSAPEGRRRIAVILSYNGSFFSGWQRQDGQRTVQEELEKAVMRLTGQKSITVQGSGRTDSGVHAWAQCAHIEMDEPVLPLRAFVGGLNSFLPKDIRIKDAWDGGRDFHARYSAYAREYRYFIGINTAVSAFMGGEVTMVDSFPDIGLLNSYASYLLGTHDFTTFSSAKDNSGSRYRDIYESRFFFSSCMFGEKVLIYQICGNAFLYRMVRSLVGSMLQFAKEGRPASDFKAVLDAADRSLCGRTAPSDGLYLWRICYDPEEYSWFENENLRAGGSGSGTVGIVL